ncbi:hypothetical protein Tco_0563411 [Tanacetum coccineum]
MSSSTITYTFVYIDSEPGRVFWGADEELSDEDTEHPPSPDYVPSLRIPNSLPIEAPYVPKPEYPEYLVPSDVEAPLEDQPLPADASPTALSPGYVVDSDPDEDPEEDPKEDHADYLADGGDGDDEPFYDDDDDTVVEGLSVRLSDMSQYDVRHPWKGRIVEDVPHLHHHYLVASPPSPLPSPLTTSPTDAGAPLVYRARLAPTTLEGAIGPESEELDTTVRQGTVEFQTLSLQTQLTITLGHIESLRGSVDQKPQKKMATRKEPTKASPATTTPLNIYSYTDAQLKALIERGITAVLAERDADRSR